MGTKEAFRGKYVFLSTVWLHAFELHLEVVSDTINYEDYVIRGRFDSKPNFVVMYLRSDSVRRYFVANHEYEKLEVMNELISKGVNVSGKFLVNGRHYPTRASI